MHWRVLKWKAVVPAYSDETKENKQETNKKLGSSIFDE